MHHPDLSFSLDTIKMVRTFSSQRRIAKARRKSHKYPEREEKDRRVNIADEYHGVTSLVRE